MVEGGTFNMENGNIGAGRSKSGWCYAHSHNIRREIFGTGIRVIGGSSDFPSKVNIYGGSIEGRGHLLAPGKEDIYAFKSENYPVFVDCSTAGKTEAEVNIYGGDFRGYGATNAVGYTPGWEDCYTIYGGHFSTSPLKQVKIHGDCLDISGPRYTGLRNDMIYSGSDLHYNLSDVKTSTDVTVAMRGPRMESKPLPNPTVGQSYYAKLNAVGIGQLTYSIRDGSLPKGLYLDEKTGVIQGKPTPDAKGMHEFAVYVEDSLGNLLRVEYSVWVNSGDESGIISDQSFTCKAGEYFFERFNLDTEYGEVYSLAVVEGSSNLPAELEYGYSAEGVYLRGTPKHSGHYHALFLIQRLEDYRKIYHTVNFEVKPADMLINAVSITSEFSSDGTQIINYKTTVPTSKVTKVEYAKDRHSISSLVPGEKVDIAFTLQAEPGYKLDSTTAVFWNGVKSNMRIVTGDTIRYAFQIEVPQPDTASMVDAVKVKVDAPKTGSILASAQKADASASGTIVDTEWLVNGKKVETGSAAKPGTAYTVKVTLAADPNTRYGLSETKAFLNDKAAAVITANDFEFVLQFTFPATTGELVFPFTDVPENQWYYEWVKAAYDMGLIDGMSPTTFQPDGNMTYAQAITLAARMNQKYETGTVTLQNGTVNWYDSYVEYCLKHNIIDSDYSSVINTKIDRHNFAHIFANALESAALKPINNIPYGSIPDVNSGYAYEEDIYTLYRAGILNGSKPDGTFNPDSNIKRSEVAAILVRMMDPSVRVGPPADLAY